LIVEKEEEFKQMFNNYDLNSDGVISVLELISMAFSWGIELNAEKSLSLIQRFNSKRSEKENAILLEKSFDTFETSQVCFYNLLT
jgi:Ca2+-binding EF-hand superfamily protein